METTMSVTSQNTSAKSSVHPAEELRNANWLHLDLKGTIPSAAKLLAWIDWFTECGFNGIVFEYEDRIDWPCWPGVFRPGYNRDEWREIHSRCRKNGLEIVPLIQTHGHLEWLLKHEPYAYLRENGILSELCPSHPEALDRMRAFIDECIALHPDSRYIHLGADETWHLGSCPVCAAKAADDPRGRLGLYIDHVGPLCRHVLKQGRFPLVWADMWWREERMDLCSLMPENTVLVEWRYQGKGPFEKVNEFLSNSCTVMGASAVSCGFDEMVSLVQQRVGPRIDNVVGWRTFARDNGIGVIHTTWNRSASLRPIYGPWHGQIPAYIAAGDPDAWESHRLAEFFRDMEVAQQNYDSLHNAVLDSFIEKAESLAEKESSPFLAESLRWHALAMEYRRLVNKATIAFFGDQCLRQVSRFTNPDEVWCTQRFVEGSKKLQAQLAEWEKSARAFWDKNAYSDAEEFFASRCGVLRELLEEIVAQDIHDP